MIRAKLVLIGVIGLLLLAASNSTGDAKTDFGHPRFAPPQRGETRGWVDVEQYLLMADPREAGRLLLSEAEQAHVDVDDSTHTCDDSAPIYLPKRNLHLTKNKHDLKPAGELGYEGTNEPVAILVKYRRFPTIRERAEALSQGIRFSRPFREGAEVVIAPPLLVSRIAEMSYVRWAEPFKPEYKYEPELALRQVPNNAIVESALGDDKLCREELNRLGVVVLSDDGFGLGSYWVTMEPTKLRDVAQLWWVISINEVIPKKNHAMPADEASYGGWSSSDSMDTKLRV